MLFLEKNNKQHHHRLDHCQDPLTLIPLLLCKDARTNCRNLQRLFLVLSYFAINTELIISLRATASRFVLFISF